jgi:hypothetical protein
MRMDLFAFGRWLEDTWWATTLRESGYAYPFVEGSHVIALALSVGAVLWFDLRLLGWTMRDDRCSSLTYSRYARSSRLAGRAPRRPQ